MSKGYAILINQFAKRIIKDSVDTQLLPTLSMYTFVGLQHKHK